MDTGQKNFLTFFKVYLFSAIIVCSAAPRVPLLSVNILVTVTMTSSNKSQLPVKMILNKQGSNEYVTLNPRWSP